MTNSLSKDRFVQGIVIALALASAPILVPGLGQEWLAAYGHYVVDAPFLAALLLAIRLRLRQTTDIPEQRFWTLLAFGILWWLAALAIAPGAELLLSPGLLLQIAKQAPYLLFFAAIILALEIHPHVQLDPITHQLRLLNRAGSIILLFGMLSYFLVVPALTREGGSATWASSLSLFVAFDVYIVLRLWFFRELAVTHEWRSVYTWLLIGAVIWGTGDLLLLLMYEHIVTDPGWGTSFDLIWPASFAAMVVATRPGVVIHPRASDTGQVHTPLGMGPLVIYCLAPLIVHVTLYRFGFSDEENRMSREFLVLGMTAILASMTLVYHLLLRTENSRLAVEEASARENLAHQAVHDELTGLPNKNLYRDRLRRAIADAERYRTKCAVLFLDLDQFKVINDSLGHEAGDQALITTSKRLLATVRKQDTVARFGGDEFAIVVQGMHQPLDATFLAEKLLKAIGRPLIVTGKSHVLTASIGIAVYPDDGDEVEALLKHADTAMYQSKLHGRNTYRLFTEAMNEAAQERLTIEQGLRTGLLEDRFAVFYQPVIDLDSGQPIAYEALLRWNHPERGYISPVNFIDVAEQTGLIVPIGKWVLETACTWAAQLDPDEKFPPAVSVNISPRQFRDPDLVRDIVRVLAITRLAPFRLQLEITETMALSLDSTAETLRRLRGLGIKIAIDDFGTGYAALSLLQDLPVDIVKIDRSFVSAIEPNSVSEAIVRAIVTMAEALDFYVVAEGVETQQELDVIRRSNCDAVQGYYLCKPQPPEEIKKMMASGTLVWS